MEGGHPITLTLGDLKKKSGRVIARRYQSGERPTAWDRSPGERSAARVALFEAAHVIMARVVK